jgi:hypothetical protein
MSPQDIPLPGPGTALPESPKDGREEITFPGEFRPIDGWGNNPSHPDWGTAGRPFYRLVENAYADGTGSPAGQQRPGARAISNAVSAQPGPKINSRSASDFLWQWGQFLDHDIDETPTITPAEAFNIPVPPGDPWFDPSGTGSMEIPLNRSLYTVQEGVRQQINAITSYIDASNVYGSDETRALALRRLDGSGKLKTTPSDHGDLLPYNLAGLPNAPSPSPIFFLAGDVRANEQIGLTAMHTLFVREHNYWADRFDERLPGMTGDQLYHLARMMVAAEMQAITYREFLPLLLGPGALPSYEGYNPEVCADISNVFAAAAYRLGHSLLSPTLLRIDAGGNESAAGHIALSAAFFRPSEIEIHGIDGILRGLAAQKCQELDNFLIDDVRNFLFGPPGAGGFDLAALNMQRGRDHGIPGYIDVCEAIGQQPAASFDEIHPDPKVWKKLASVYGHVDEVDCWIGGLCEPHARGAMVGPMIREVLVDQFTRLRDGDRFFYEHHLSPSLVNLVEHQTLARIIIRNTGIDNELAHNVFLVSKQAGPPKRSWPDKGHELGQSKRRLDPDRSEKLNDTGRFRPNNPGGGSR